MIERDPGSGGPPSSPADPRVLERALDRAVALGRLAHALASAQPGLEAVLQACATEIQRIVGDSVFVLLRVGDSDDLRLAAGAADAPAKIEIVTAMLQASPARVGEGLSGRCMAEGRPLRFEDMPAAMFERLIPPEKRPHVRDILPRAALSVPLTARGERIGALTLTRDAPPRFDPDEIEFVEAMCAHAAVAIANARLHHDVRRANAELHRAEGELRRTISDLEAFSSSVSHDLRGPVRAIDALTQIVLEEHAATLDPDATDLLHRVRGNARRMAELIDDLLRLARVGRLPLHRRRVDLTALATEVAAGIAAHRPDREVAVEIAPALTVDADPGLLRIVLENLVDNAFKFTARTAGRAHVRVEAAGAPGEGFAIVDDGAGFDPAHRTRLFQPFQRLHAQSEFPGHGIGLATVERIVARHGGRVDATGQPGSGARFVVTLPQQSDTNGE
ncbi:ATP-binding protein [Myxococcota bacterium]|nr:ATP-binding protein [Myxococcota bacterium]